MFKPQTTAPSLGDGTEGHSGPTAWPIARVEGPKSQAAWPGTIILKAASRPIDASPSTAKSPSQGAAGRTRCYHARIAVA